MSALIPPFYAGGVRQNFTIGTAAATWPLTAIPNVATDDMVILCVMFINLNAVVSNLNGWTQLFLQDINTRRWGVWYRRRLITDAAAYSTPQWTSTAGGGNLEAQQSAWRGVDWSAPLLIGSVGNRSASVATTDAPSINALPGSTAIMLSFEATNAVENDGSEIIPTGWTKAIGYGDQTTASVSIEHALTLYKSMPNGGATGTATVTWANASLNGSGLQLGVLGLPARSAVDATGVKFWNPATGTWISASRGPKGATGATGPTGPTGSERTVKTLAHRQLGAGQSLPQGWTTFNVATTPYDASESNPPITIVPGSPVRFRFTKAGAYLITINSWIDQGAAGVGERSFMLFDREPFGSNGAMWAQNAWGPGQAATVLTTVVLALPADSFFVQFYRSETGTKTHTTHMYVTPLGPCRVGNYDYAVVVDGVDYSSTNTKVSTYTVTPQTFAVVPGDWMYLSHMHVRESPDIVPALPQGWEVVLPPQRIGPLAGFNGVDWSIWRKKYVAGDSCTVNLAGARYVRAALFTMRQPTDAMPTLSAFPAPREWANPSVVSVPGALANSSGIAIAVNYINGTWLSQPPTVSAPGRAWINVGSAATENMMMSLAILDPPVPNTNPVTFSWVGKDAGVIGGVTLIWPRVALP